MKIIMAGLDYQRANIDLRERVSFTKTRVREIIKKIKNLYKVNGVALICTCNRTEIYISYNEEEKEIDPSTILCRFAEVDINEYKQLFYMKENEEAARHLLEVSCGIHSMIYGEDQIISQVKDAIKIANEEKVSDSILNTLFRYAITCAKKVKTNIVLKKVSPSVAKKAVDILDEYIKQNTCVRALVIGNGEVGRNVCNELISKGCETYITLRTYKHGLTVVPNGCQTIDYDTREDYIDKVDVIISATASPHHTINYQMVEKHEKKPKYIIDLAVPRDIDPEIKNIEGINFFNIDTIGKDALKDNNKEIAIVNEIIQDQIDKYYEWLAVHSCRKDISYIKELTYNKITENLEKELTEDEKIEKAVSKTVDFILYSLKDEMTPLLLNNIKEKIVSRR